MPQSLQTVLLTCSLAASGLCLLIMIYVWVLLSLRRIASRQVIDAVESRHVAAADQEHARWRDLNDRTLRLTRRLPVLAALSAGFLLLAALCLL